MIVRQVTRFFPLLAVLVLMGCATTSDVPTLRYLAVQQDKGEGWSIVNDRGKIVANDEYDSSDRLSMMFDDSYWVKSNKKFLLYNIDNPKKPVSDVEYDHVTNVINDRTFVERLGQPIKFLNGEGKVVATLPEDVTEASITFGNYYLFRRSNGKYGWIDHEGKIVKEGFTTLFLGMGDKCIVGRKGEEGNFVVYNGEGKEQGKIKGDEVLSVTDDYIIVRSGEQPTCYTNTGQTRFRLKSVMRYFSAFFGGYAIFTSNRDESFKSGLINDNGEEIIRAKYDYMGLLGDNLIMVGKNGMYGIVDVNDETIVDFDYNGVGATLGSLYVMKDGKDWVMIDREGKQQNEFDIYDIDQSGSAQQSVKHIDLMSLGREIAQLAKDFDPETTAIDVAAQESLEPEESKKNIAVIDVTKQLGGNNVTVTYLFDGSVVDELTHNETRNDGWWDYVETVVDGYAWSNTKLKSLYFYLSVDGMDVYEFEENLRYALTQNGFEPSTNGRLVTSVNHRERYITLEAESSQLLVTISE